MILPWRTAVVKRLQALQATRTRGPHRRLQPLAQPGARLLMQQPRPLQVDPGGQLSLPHPLQLPTLTLLPPLTLPFGRSGEPRRRRQALLPGLRRLVGDLYQQQMTGLASLVGAAQATLLRSLTHRTAAC